MTNLNRRDFALFGASFVAAGLVGRPILAAPPEPAIDPSYLKLVDPELRQMATAMMRVDALTQPISDQTLAAMRRRGNYAARPRPEVPCRKIEITGPAGAPPVTIYLINEKAGGVRPAILHTHGGGFILGTAAQGIPGLQTLAATLDCVIVTVEYRLAPETHYAGSIEDNYTGLRWLYDHAGEIGADRGRIAVMGESAGGGHAALLAITARDRGEIPLIFQCLIYPMLDDRTGSARPVPPTVGKIIWNASSNRYGWRSFLGQKPGTGRVPTGAVPARVASVKGLPPAFIGVGTLDLFVDEDVDYSRRLIDAGIATELLVVPGAYHGFDFSQTGIARRFNNAKIDALRRAFGATSWAA